MAGLIVRLGLVSLRMLSCKCTVLAAILGNSVGGQQLGLADHLGVPGVPWPHQCVLHGNGDLEQSIDVSEFASLDPSLPHGLGLNKVVTVEFVVCGHGEPHEQV